MYDGSGATPIARVKVYVLLAVRGIEGADVRAIANRFRRTAKHTNVYVGGEIVDLDADRALQNALSKTGNGKELFARILSSTPVICLSNSYIGDVTATDKVELLKFSDYATNPEQIFEIIDRKMITPDERTGWVEFLSGINEILVLRPALFGMGIDLNKIISKYLPKK